MVSNAVPEPDSFSSLMHQSLEQMKFHTTLHRLFRIHKSAAVGPLVGASLADQMTSAGPLLLLLLSSSLETGEKMGTRYLIASLLKIQCPASIIWSFDERGQLSGDVTPPSFLPITEPSTPKKR